MSKQNENEETKNNKKPIIIGIIIAVVAIAAVLFIILSKKKEEYRTIKVTDIKGTVDYTRDNEKMDVFIGMALVSGDRATVGDSSYIELLADSDKHIVAKDNTTFSVKASGSEKNGNITVNVEEGYSLILIENKLEENSTFEVNTPNASLSVRGTTFEVEYNKALGQTHVKVMEGVVKVWTNTEEAMLEAGDEAYIVDEEITTNDNAGSGTGDGTGNTPDSGDGTDVGTGSQPGKNWYNFEKAEENSMEGAEWSSDQTLLDTVFESFRTAVMDIYFYQTDVATIDEIISLGEVDIAELDKYPWRGNGQNGYIFDDMNTFCGAWKSALATESFAQIEEMLKNPDADGHIYISEIEIDEAYRVTHMIIKLGGTDAYMEFIGNY